MISRADADLLVVLMFVLWYCYKRGREERLKGEEEGAVDGGDRIEELPDDPALPAPASVEPDSSDPVSPDPVSPVSTRRTDTGMTMESDLYSPPEETRPRREEKKARRRYRPDR